MKTKEYGKPRSHIIPASSLLCLKRNGSVPFPHTNGPFPSVSKRKEPSFYSRTVAERNGTVRGIQSGLKWVALTYLSDADRKTLLSVSGVVLRIPRNLC